MRILLVTVASLFLVSHAKVLDCSFQQEYRLREDITMRQVTNQVNKTVTIELTYNGLAWIGIGFSTSGTMIGTTAVIGLPGEPVGHSNPAKYYLSGKNSDGVNLVADDAQTLTDSWIVQNSTHTTLSFTKPLVDTEGPEVLIDGNNTFVVAIGANNDLGYHAIRGRATLPFTPCRILEDGNPGWGTDSIAPSPFPWANPTLAPSNKKWTDSPTRAPKYPSKAPAVSWAPTTPTASPVHGVPSTAGDERKFDLEGGLLQLTLAPNLANEELSVKLIYAGLGWLGFGFSEQGNMVGSTAVIGLPGQAVSNSNPAKFLLGGKTLSAVTLKGENIRGVTNGLISQNGTHTILEFTKPFREDDVVDVNPNGLNNFIYAYGSGSSLGVHRGRGLLSVDFNSNKQSVAPSPSPVAPGAGDRNDGNTIELEGGLLSLSLKPNPVDSTLTVVLTIAKRCWLAFGFSEAGRMVGSTAVIGLPGEGNIAAMWSLAGKSVSAVTLLPAGRQKLINASVVQNDTHTVLSFTKLFEEDGVVPINVKGNNNFLYAYGRDNELSVHAGRGNLPIDLSSLSSPVEVQSGVSTRRLWVVHGLLMALAWGVMVPLAIGCSLLRNLLPLSPGMWFNLHRGINSTGLVMILTGFFLAIAAISKESAGGEKPYHFSGSKHRTAGLIIVLAAAVQFLSGIFRPHLPQTTGGHTMSRHEGTEALEDGVTDQVESGANIVGKMEEANIQDGAHLGDASVRNKSAPVTKSTARRVWEYQHRLMGLTLLGSAWYNCDTGLEQLALRYGSAYDKTAVFWGVVGGLAGLIFLTNMIYKAYLLQCNKSEN